MKKVELSIKEQGIICAESLAGPNGFVVFGASGDLVRRKLLLSLFRLFNQSLLCENFYFLGVGRTELSDEQFRLNARQAIRENSPDLSTKELESFTNHLYFSVGDYGDISLYSDIKSKINQLDEKYHTGRNVIYYLSVPPLLYEQIIEMLGTSGLSCLVVTDLKLKSKLVVEKPFG
ncbi:glucose-6-phosphate dehydrogenase, partial [Planctomycetota bacterium]